MDAASTAAFALFAAVAAFTPGPNNVMLAASGATFGFRGTIPHILGIIVGFGLLVLAGGFGFAGLLAAFPAAHTLLRVAGILFLLYLAWRIGTAGRPEDRPASRPLNFWQAAAFQMINPKGLTILASAISVYSSGPDGVADALVVMLPIFLTVTVFSACTWCFFGTLIGRLLTEDRALRWFNMIMAMLIVLSLLPMLTE